MLVPASDAEEDDKGRMELKVREMKLVRPSQGKSSPITSAYSVWGENQ